MRSIREFNVSQKKNHSSMPSYYLWRTITGVFLLLAMAGNLSYGQVSTTLIQDTIYHADGTYASGTVLVTWPAFSTANGDAIPAGNLTTQIGANGSIFLNLTPNFGATPAGTYYTAVYHLDDGTVSTEYWVVPAVTQTTITAMRSEVMPASVAVQMVSQAYISNLISNYLPVRGGSMQGALLLNADPQSALQAATKEYVDSNVQGIASSLSQKVATTPTTTQGVNQPAGTTLMVNNLNRILTASQYQAGAGNNGIANAVAQGCTGTGCTIMADPGYAQTEQSIYDTSGGTIGLPWPTNTSLWDYRGGTNSLSSHDPTSPWASQGLQLNTDFDIPSSAFNAPGRGASGVVGGIQNNLNLYTGTNNTQNTLGGIPMVGGYGAIENGVGNYVNRYDSGQTFNQWNSLSCHGTGDCISRFTQVSVDGGVNRRDDEGTHLEDANITEDASVFTGTINAAVSAGATTIPTSCTYGCGSQGQDRLLIDTNASKEITGTFEAGSAITAVNQIPSGVVDTTANYPVSTFVSLCYAGSDNGAGGAAGCPSGTAPSGWIPPQATSPSQQAPSSPIVTGVLASYPNQPAAFCTNTTLQSSNSGASCYMPASGVGCLTDNNEYETVSYTYNSSTQQITLLNLTSSHLNGMVFATGGLCGYAVEEKASIYSLSTGGSGVQSQVWPVEGSINATTLYYITQRTNEGYGLPVLAGNGAGADEFSFSLTMSSFSVTSGVVTFTIPGNNGACQQAYNGLSATISTANSTYNGTYPITYVSCATFGVTTFTYTPSPAPSGTLPSTGTVSYTNMQYTLYPEARVNSVYDTTNKSVDGNFYVQPNTVAWANGDTVREPHYPELSINSSNPAVTQYIGNQGFSYAGMGVTYYGIAASSDTAGFSVTNGSPSTLFTGHGGKYPVPGRAHNITGLWATDFDITNAPDGALITVEGCKLDIGCNSDLSNFVIFGMQARHDYLTYDPAYNSGLNGTYSGRWYFGNLPNGALQDYGLALSEATVQGGYLAADKNVTSPVAKVGAISTSVVLATPSGPPTNVIGTTGSTTYRYYTIAHAVGGGVTTISPLGGENSPVYCGQGCGVTNGNATLSTTNYNQVCVAGGNAPAYGLPPVASWDILKLVGGTYYALATNLVITVANQGCVNDQGQSLSTYGSLPATNTTGQTTLVGTLNAPTVNATTGYQVNGTPLAASHLSNGTTGSGAVVLASSPTISGTVYTPIVTGTQGVTIAPLPAAGSGASASCYTGSGSQCTASSGFIQLYTGSSPSIGGQFQVSWTTPTPHSVNCIVGAGGGAAPESSAGLLPGTNNNFATSFNVDANVAPAAYTSYYFTYICGN